MNWFLSMFTAFADLQTLAQLQAQNIEDLTAKLTEEVVTHEATKQDLQERIRALESERTRRIAAESIASERRGEIERLTAQYYELREDLTRVLAERIKSVDALNVKLMRESVPEPAPDLAQFQAKQKNDHMNPVMAARENERLMSWALIEKLHPTFAKRRATLNEPISPPIEAEV